METSSLTRRDREREARRRAILDAALATFAEKGFEGATLDEVAERAEFGKGTLYNYFPGGKEAILFALFDEVYDDLVELTNDFFASDEAEGHIRDVFALFVERMISNFLERLPIFMLLIKEAHRMTFDDEIENATYMIEQRDRVATAIAKPLEKAMRNGSLRKLDAHTVAHVIMGNVHGYLMYKCTLNTDGERRPSSEDGAQFIATLLFDGLLAHRG